MKNNKKLLKNIIKTLICGVVIFFMILLIKAADWYIEWYSVSGFAIVVYQMLSPLQGTGKETIDSFMSEAFRSALLISMVIVSVMVFFNILFDRHMLSIHYRRGCKTKDVTISRRLYQLIHRWTVIVLLVSLFAIIIRKAYLVGIPEYIDQMKNASTIYEEEYVDPKSVNIEMAQGDRNVIILYLESMMVTYADKEHGGYTDVNYIPELTALAMENVNISTTDMMGGFHPYDMGFTTAGIVGSSAGVNYKAAVQDAATMKYYSKCLPGITTIGDVLKDHGYDNYFLCGSDAEFSGRRQFFEDHGDYKVMDLYYAREKEYVPADYDNGFWGYEDEYLYKIARSELTDIAAQGRPFNFTMLTVDTHGPSGYICDLCGSEYPEQMANAVSCSSRQAYDFINWVKEQPWYENTTIIVMGDHTSMSPDFMTGMKEYEQSVYDCFINMPDSVNTDNIKGREFSTVDMFPSILAAMGAQIEGDQLGLGVNLFSDKPTLPERLGREYFEKEIAMFSKYYQEHFVGG